MLFRSEKARRPNLVAGQLAWSAAVAGPPAKSPSRRSPANQRGDLTVPCFGPTEPTRKEKKKEEEEEEKKRKRKEKGKRKKRKEKKRKREREK